MSYSFSTLATKYAEIDIHAENLFDKKYEEQVGDPLSDIIGVALKLTF